MSSAAQGHAADDQQQDAIMQDDTAAAAAAAPANGSARRVSPFRREMQGKLIRRIHKKRAQPWLQAVLQQLRQLVPNHADLDSAAAGNANDNRLLALLSRANFARRSPSVVSLSEVAMVSDSLSV
jgi:hypothetical protein